MESFAPRLRPIRTFLSICAGSVRRTFSENLPLYACAALFAPASWLAAWLLHVSPDTATSALFLELAIACLSIGALILVLYGIVHLALSGFPDSPLRLLGEQFFGWLAKGERPGNILHFLVAFTILESCFRTLKEAIPLIHPFDWDRIFMHWGLVLGGGVPPWKLLQPLLDYQPVTLTLNAAYYCWFFVMFGCLFWQAFSAKGGVLRLQFLLAFSFAWFIGGNVLAVIFSSAGPCFYGFLFHGPNPYAAQLAYLSAAEKGWPWWSVGVQRMMWDSYAAGHGTLGGISAMPSMHVTIATLLAIWGWRVNRGLGTALSLFALTIFIASIHLLWHYAADSVAGVVLAVAFWMAAGAVARSSLRYLERHRSAAAAAMGAAQT